MDVPAVECNRVEEGVGGCFVPICEALIMVCCAIDVVVMETWRYDGGACRDVVRRNLVFSTFIATISPLL